MANEETYIRTARRANQSILKEINHEYSLEGLMLKLKLQYFGHLMRRTDSLEKTLMVGKLKEGEEGDDRGWECWMASLTLWTDVWVNSGSWWWTGRPGVLQSVGSQRVGHDWVTEMNWTDEQKPQKPYFTELSKPPIKERKMKKLRLQDVRWPIPGP